MPELPEVETVRRGLARVLTGRRIARCDVHDPRLVHRSPLPADVVVGDRVRDVRRRGKWLFVDCDDCVVVAHLRMSGQLLVGDAGVGTTTAPRCELACDDGTVVRFVDQRRFGELLVCTPEDAAAIERRLGPDADTLTTAQLRRAFAGSGARCKAALTDQRRIAGVGNMYADEALWRARLDPRRPAGALDDVELRRLARAVRAVMRDALAAGGASTRDGLYVDTDGEAGWFAVELAVYQRTGEPCPRCATPVERYANGASGTHWCPRCQSGT
jgi:formamidopyrimidine-DNA glycosylase